MATNNARIETPSSAGPVALPRLLSGVVALGFKKRNISKQSMPPCSATTSGEWWQSVLATKVLSISLVNRKMVAMRFGDEGTARKFGELEAGGNTFR